MCFQYASSVLTHEYFQYLAVILGGLVFLWLRAANSLATQFEDAMKAPDAA